MIFRIDDVSVNNAETALVMMKALRTRYSDCKIIAAVSPLVFDMSKSSGLAKERVFPSRLNCMSDHREFFKCNKLGVPMLPDDVQSASHSMWHVDHRLLSKEVQEAGIITSCALIGTDIFVPPFHKYNQDTIDICDEHAVELIKWDESWCHIGYQEIMPEQYQKYYFHTHDLTVEELNRKLEL